MNEQIGADPNEVIDRMAAQLGSQFRDMAVAQTVIAAQEKEISKLRAQLAAATDQNI